MSSRSKDPMGSATSVDEIITILAVRGCRDLTAHINWAECGKHPIAGGEFCDVYQGKLYDSTQIAIRSLRIFDSPGENNRASVLKNAAKALCHWSRLRHRNVLLFMGLAIYRDQISMVSEWMSNGNLSQYLAKHPQADRLALCRDICTGLQYIHTQGMVHGDLKAANVMVSSEGGAMIAGFGNARLKELTVKFTGTAAIIHSLRWTAPELLMEESEPSIQSDIYGYGMTALETFTGEIPHRDLNNTQLLFRMSTGLGKPLRPAGGISDSVWTILDSCWSPKPEARPSLNSIEECLWSQAVLQDRDSAGSTVPKVVPRDSITRPMTFLEITAGRRSASTLANRESRNPGEPFEARAVAVKEKRDRERRQSEGRQKRPSHIVIHPAYTGPNAGDVNQRLHASAESNSRGLLKLSDREKRAVSVASVEVVTSSGRGPSHEPHQITLPNRDPVEATHSWAIQQAEECVRARAELSRRSKREGHGRKSGVLKHQGGTGVRKPGVSFDFPAGSIVESDEDSLESRQQADIYMTYELEFKEKRYK